MRQEQCSSIFFTFLLLFLLSKKLVKRIHNFVRMSPTAGSQTRDPFHNLGHPQEKSQLLNFIFYNSLRKIPGTHSSPLLPTARPTGCAGAPPPKATGMAPTRLATAAAQPPTGARGERRRRAPSPHRGPGRVLLHRRLRLVLRAFDGEGRLEAARFEQRRRAKMRA